MYFSMLGIVFANKIHLAAVILLKKEIKFISSFIVSTTSMKNNG